MPAPLNRPDAARAEVRAPRTWCDYGADMVEHTPDGRYIVVDGRRWRATDPILDEDVQARLRQHLGKARSAIGRTRGEEARRPWRDRVQLAKTGLGERGAPWWELTEDERHERATAALAELDTRPTPPLPGPGSCAATAEIRR